MGFGGAASKESKIDDDIGSTGGAGLGAACLVFGGATSKESKMEDDVGSADGAGLGAACLVFGGAASKESKMEDDVGSDGAAGLGLGGGTSKESKIEEDDIGSDGGGFGAPGLGFGGAASNESKIDDAVFDGCAAEFCVDPLCASQLSIEPTSLYSGSAKFDNMRMDGISIPHPLKALDTSNADDHSTRFLGFILFSSDGPEQKLMISFAFFRTREFSEVSVGSLVLKTGGNGTSSIASISLASPGKWERRNFASFGRPSQISCRDSKQMSFSASFGSRTLRALLPSLGFQLSYLIVSSCTSVELSPMFPDPANPPPPPMLPRLKPPPIVRLLPEEADDFGAFSTSRATKKASDGSCSCDLITSNAVLIMGGSASKKNDAAEKYFRLRRRLYAFFITVFLPLSDEKSISIMKFKNFLPWMDLSVAAMARNFFMLRVAM